MAEIYKTDKEETIKTLFINMRRMFYVCQRKSLSHIYTHTPSQAQLKSSHTYVCIYELSEETYIETIWTEA